jgi:hypothetical protein
LDEYAKRVGEKQVALMAAVEPDFTSEEAGGDPDARARARLRRHGR